MNEASVKENVAVGRVTQVLGAVVDVQFAGREVAAADPERADHRRRRHASWCSRWRSSWASSPSAPSPWTRPTA